MKYTVVWTTTAENELGELWLQSADRQSVSDAANRLEVELKRDPTGSSIVLSEKYREIYLKPLLMVFSVSEADRKVTVASVGRR